MGKKKGAEVSPLLHPGRTAGPTLMRRGGSCRVSKVIAVSVHAPTLRGRGRGVKVCTVRRGRPPPTPLRVVASEVGATAQVSVVPWAGKCVAIRRCGGASRGNRAKPGPLVAAHDPPASGCDIEKTLISRTKSRFFAPHAFVVLHAARARANFATVTSYGVAKGSKAAKSRGQIGVLTTKVGRLGPPSK